MLLVRPGKCGTPVPRFESRSKIVCSTPIHRSRLMKSPRSSKDCRMPISAFEIVSEQGKDGVAFYESLGEGSAIAHGSQDYLNCLPRAWSPTFLHEAGHILEQRANVVAPGILELWEEAIEADDVSVSRYGDGARHEDQAEFAMLYGGCLDAGPEALAELRDASPERYALWERILRLTERGSVASDESPK